MKYSVSILLVLCLAGSCRTRVDSPRSMNPAAAIRQKAIDEIREADQNFSIMSEKQGMAKAFTSYAANDVIRMNEGAAPTVGFDSLRAQMSRMPENGPTLTWQVLKADAAQSGELGYTFGQWMLTGKDESGKRKAQYGVYVTVWKRQRNGQWRFVLDGGNTTPEPKIK
jgi:ketosteroid isomerase-like protein